MVEKVKICLNCGAVGTFNDVTNLSKIVASSPNIHMIIFDDYSRMEKITCSVEDKCLNCGEKQIRDIDDEIAWYIYQLNKAGYETKHSCAGHPSDLYTRFHISFKNRYPDIEKFAKNNFKYLEYYDTINCTDKYGVRYNISKNAFEENKNRMFLTKTGEGCSLYNYEDFCSELDKYEKSIGVIRSSYTDYEDYFLAMSNKSREEKRFITLDDPNMMTRRHLIYSDLMNLVTNLCIDKNIKK